MNDVLTGKVPVTSDQVDRLFRRLRIIRRDTEHCSRRLEALMHEIEDAQARLRALDPLTTTPSATEEIQ